MYINNNLLQFIEKVVINLSRLYKFSNNEFIMYNAIKLSEEVGELNSEVLKKLKFARKEKLENLDNEEIKLEIADVILSTMVLAKSLDIDVNEAIELKINKINKRGGI